MKGNDLGNRVVPRDVLVWEGLLGILPDPKVAKQEEKFRAKQKWSEAVACYDLNELLAKRIHYMAWHHDLEVDLLTYLGHDFARALEERMDREQMPIRYTWHEELNQLARRISYSAEIRTVYDPDPNHQFTYGPKGRVLVPDTAHHYFGVL